MEANITISQFITVMLAVISAAGAIIYLLLNRISSLEISMGKLEDKIKDNSLCILNLQEDQDIIKEKRNQDLLDFTKILASINTTLAKFEVTIGHFEATMKEIKLVVEDLKSNE